MAKLRRIKERLTAAPVIEGAGVHLKRAFGHAEAPGLDPFLLLDDFHSNDPEKYLKGFPWHPHRGIETVTYVLHGEVDHGDSMGNKGVISSGDIQWMTAGNGIIHQEMPKGDQTDLLWGFQLWVNLPAASKMMPPRYREVNRREIPEVPLENESSVRVIAGTFNGIKGPVRDIVVDPAYFDIQLSPGTDLSLDTTPGHTVLAYVFKGEGIFSPGDTPTGPETLIRFEDGDQVVASAQAETLRFLLVSGAPINEPVAWRGPIVMNTREELETAFREYRNQTFLKHQKP